jgi:hypothetical protein
MNSRKEAAAMRMKAKRGKAIRAKTKLGLPDLESKHFIGKACTPVRGCNRTMD